ncbi:unnamed protein product [Chironomus riparius]|uniref:Uncharacterized protein n=1 Tax=Chironomus riparius TaxID=315576 RepID=A0A9N9RY98_9DIPT|nr:unnamed protein product [Chironomus riparius]
MKEKSKNMNLEIISVTSNEAVPAEVEQPKKKGWTLFRNNKSKSEENAKKEIFTDGDDPNKVKIISVKPKNVESIEHDEKGNLEEIQIVNVKKTNDDKDNTEQVDEGMKTADVAVPKRRWYQWFGKRYQKKSKKTEEVTDNKAPLAEEDEAKGTESIEIEIAETETLPSKAELSDKDEHDNASMETPITDPEKRKRLTLNFFRRSTKKNKKTEKVSPTETIIEEIEIKTDEDIKTETTDDNKAESPEIVESKELAINDELAKDVAKDPQNPNEVQKEPATDDKPKEGSSTVEKSEQAEDTADVKRKGFTLKMFFRRSTKKNEKSPEEVPIAETLKDDEKIAEIKELETDLENGNATDEIVQEVPIKEPTTECPTKNEESRDIEVVMDENFQTKDNQDEKSELTIGDNTNIGDVQNADVPKNDENLPINDDAEKSVNLNAETPIKEVEQK